MLADHRLETEYVALVDPDTLAPLSELERRGLLLIAARVGGVRLIDNETVGPRARHSIHEDGVATAFPKAASTSVRIGVPMSSHPAIRTPADPVRLPMTLPLLAEKKRLGEPIVMVTAYDYPSARAAEAAGVDLVLVGDSAATTVLGYTATTPVELTDMLVLTRAVRRGLNTPLLVGDLPFGSYEISDEQAIATAMRMVKEGGCEVVKLEGGGEAPAAAPRDRRGGHPGDGPRRADPPDLDRARRLEGPGPHGRGGRADRRRGARAAGRRVLRARLRGDPERRHRRADGR